MVKAYVAGTCDTKGTELRYIKSLIEAAGLQTCLVDLSTGKGDGGPVDVPAAEVAAHHQEGARAVLHGDDRGRAVTAMADAFSQFVRTRGDIG
ncbi:uncharacterized protein METZ01_LOCUS515144, partial [marine metagenome]